MLLQQGELGAGDLTAVTVAYQLVRSHVTSFEAAY
jgi:hypothetical protein